MKTVEVFKINRESLVVPAGRVDDIQFAQYCPADNRVDLGVGPFDGIYSERKIELVQIPVTRICEFTRSRDNFGHPITKEQYIAIEPELRRLLTTKERQQVREIEILAQELSNKLTNKTSLADAWWSMPWYKRAYFAIKGRSND